MSDKCGFASSAMTRRDYMKMMGGFALSFGIGGLLTGCSSGEGDQAVSSSPDGETSKVLRVQ